MSRWEHQCAQRYLGLLKSILIREDGHSAGTLNLVEQFIKDVLAEEIAGDIVAAEPAIYAKGVLEVLAPGDRKVWVMSPAPFIHVRTSFQLYDLLDDSVRFLPDHLAESSLHIHIEKISLLHLTGAKPDTTYSALLNLGGKVSPGGFIVVDDVEAAHRFREHQSITAPLFPIDEFGVYWRRMI